MRIFEVLEETPLEFPDYLFIQGKTISTQLIPSLYTLREFFFISFRRVFHKIKHPIKIYPEAGSPTTTSHDRADHARGRAGQLAVPRVVVTRDEARRMFSAMGETFKVEIIDAIPPDEEVSLYKHGAAPHEWVDVCEGPHVPAHGLSQGGEAHARGRRVLARRRAQPDAPAHLRDRVPDAGGARRAPELARRGEPARPPQAGKELELFIFDDIAPAMLFFLPRGPSSTTHGRLRPQHYERTATKRSSPRKLLPVLFRRAATSATTTRTCTASGRRTCRKDRGPGGRPKKLQAARSPVKPINCPSHGVIFGRKRRSYC